MTTTLMGIQLWVYECLGLVIFFCAIVGLLIGYKRDIEERLSKKVEPAGQQPSVGRIGDEAPVQPITTSPLLEIGIANVLNGQDIRFEGKDGAIQTCYLEIHNASPDIDAEEVEVRVEAYDLISDLLHPRVETKFLARANVSLMFENGGYTRTIARNDRRNVRFVMYQKHPPKRWIQIGEYTEDTFDSRNKIVLEMYKLHRLDLTIRAENIMPIQKSFAVQAENDLLTVRMLE